MGRIEFESMGLFCPVGAEVFVGCQTFEGFESSGEFVGRDEVGEVLTEVLVCLVVEAFHGSFLEGSVHAFDLAVGPGMLRLGQAMIDIGFGAGEPEGVGAEEFALMKCQPDRGGCGASIAKRGEMHSVVGEYSVDRIEHELDQRVQEVGSRSLRSLDPTSCLPALAS